SLGRGLRACEISRCDRRYLAVFPKLHRWNHLLDSYSRGAQNTPSYFWHVGSPVGCSDGNVHRTCTGGPPWPPPEPALQEYHSGGGHGGPPVQVSNFAVDLT